jgi:hypothetical protein
MSRTPACINNPYSTTNVMLSGHSRCAIYWEEVRATGGQKGMGTHRTNVRERGDTYVSMQTNYFLFSVCMYDTHTHTHTHIYIYTYILKHITQYIYIYIYIYINLHIYIFGIHYFMLCLVRFSFFDAFFSCQLCSYVHCRTHIYICICIHTHVYMYIYIYIMPSIVVYIHTFIYTLIHTYLRTHASMKVPIFFYPVRFSEFVP